MLTYQELDLCQSEKNELNKKREPKLLRKPKMSVYGFQFASIIRCYLCTGKRQCDLHLRDYKSPYVGPRCDHMVLNCNQCRTIMSGD